MTLRLVELQTAEPVCVPGTATKRSHFDGKDGLKISARPPEGVAVIETRDGRFATVVPLTNVAYYVLEASTLTVAHEMPKA